MRSMSILITQLHEIHGQSSSSNFMRSMISPHSVASWDPWSIWEFIIDIKKLIYEDWSSISWSWVIRIDHGSQEVEFWGLILDFMKLTYNDRPCISWSCVIRIDHGSTEVELGRFIMDLLEIELWRLIINLMKLSYEVWSWISWSWDNRIDHGSHDVVKIYHGSHKDA